MTFVLFLPSCPEAGGQTEKKTPGNEWFWSRKSQVGARGTKGWDQGNQWLGTRYPKVGAQETNCWSPGTNDRGPGHHLFGLN